MDSSPLRRKAEQLRTMAPLLEDNWLAKRIAAIKGHEQSVGNGLQALHDMGSLILNGSISTDLLIESSQVDFGNLNASDDLGHISCSVIPSLRGVQRDIPHGLGYSWTPDVALQLTFAFTDRYNYPGNSKPPLPTGDVRLRVHARSWGRMPREEMEEINLLGNGENTWAEYSDQGHGRRGTHVSAIRNPGEPLTRHEAETMLAPLAVHVTGYFTLTGNQHLAALQRPGNFTSIIGV